MALSVSWDESERYRIQTCFLPRTAPLEDDDDLPSGEMLGGGRRDDHLLEGLTRSRSSSGITRSSFAWAPSTAGAAPERPSLRAESRPSASAIASSSVNIIGGSLKPGLKA